jgi:hypothetical protein
LLIAIQGIFYVLYKVIYNVYFHPLARYPGPRLAAISNIYYARHWPGGRWPFILEELHEKYGEVVRYAPNDLSVSAPIIEMQGSNYDSGILQHHEVIRISTGT